ncbi:unnamed protein product [marine sediment metagenome]|uniref:Uncharacterized protein n=1 Tax=marine sediment metagenome TaxID=412755 RepID=X1E911_9ZZZZ
MHNDKPIFATSVLILTLFQTGSHCIETPYRQRGYGTTVGAIRPDGNSDDDQDVDNSDLAAWDVSFGNGSTPLVSTLSVSDQPSTPPSQQAATSAVQASTLDLRAELVDAAIAMDLVLRSESGARLGTHETLRDDHFDWVSHRARWGQTPAWRGTGEIANNLFRGHSSKVNDGRFHRDADDGVDEELLDSLFAGVGLIELL